MTAPKLPVHSRPRTAIVLQLVAIVLVENRCRDATDLNSSQLRVVVCLIAARRVGRPGATASELREVTGVRGASMAQLERFGWVMPVARIEGSTELVWAPTPRAAPLLELAGWQVLLFTEEQLPFVDANAPDFLDHPGIVSTTGEAVEGERAAS